MAASCPIPHQQEQLFHVAGPELRTTRQMLLQQPNLFRGNLVLHELALSFEKRLHVSDEGLGCLGRLANAKIEPGFCVRKGPEAGAESEARP
jgi:hypothetical protein